MKSKTPSRSLNWYSHAHGSGSRLANSIISNRPKQVDQERKLYYFRFTYQWDLRFYLNFIRFFCNIKQNNLLAFIQTLLKTILFQSLKNRKNKLDHHEAFEHLELPKHNSVQTFAKLISLKDDTPFRRLSLSMWMYVSEEEKNASSSQYRVLGNSVRTFSSIGKIGHF